jgi:hypothetical protein
VSFRLPCNSQSISFSLSIHCLNLAPKGKPAVDAELNSVGRRSSVVSERALASEERSPKGDGSTDQQRRNLNPSISGSLHFLISEG